MSPISLRSHKDVQNMRVSSQPEHHGSRRVDLKKIEEAKTPNTETRKKNSLIIKS
jgi:hypothetical protein